MYLPLLLFFSAIFFSGLCVYFIPKLPKGFYQLLMVFGGSYLFSFMLSHMLPDLFSGDHHGIPKLGGYLLAGFFLQILLDFFSHGAAHGHGGTDIEKHTHHLSLTKGISLFVALFLHSLLEGILLGAFTKTTSCSHHRLSLIAGILLHEIPTALTLGMMLKRAIANKFLVIALVAVFASALPIGCLGVHYLQAHNVFSPKVLLAIQAVAIGSLLHIATTILFEANPDHHFKLKQLIVVSVGGIVALII